MACTDREEPDRAQRLRLEYTSLAHTDRVDALGVAFSVGSRRRRLEHRAAAAWVATFRSELADGRRSPSFEHAEHETFNLDRLYNAERLHEELDDLPPAE